MGRPSHRHPAPNGDSFCSGALTSSHIADTTGASKIFFCDSETGCRDSDGYGRDRTRGQRLLPARDDPARSVSVEDRRKRAPIHNHEQRCRGQRQHFHVAMDVLLGRRDAAPARRACDVRVTRHEMEQREGDYEDKHERRHFEKEGQSNACDDLQVLHSMQ